MSAFSRNLAKNKTWYRCVWIATNSFRKKSKIKSKSRAAKSNSWSQNRLTQTLSSAPVKMRSERSFENQITLLRTTLSIVRCGYKWTSNLTPEFETEHKLTECNFWNFGRYIITLHCKLSKFKPPAKVSVYVFFKLGHNLNLFYPCWILK